MSTKIEFTKVNRDINGNPRYACHFSSFITDKDEEQIKKDFKNYLEQHPFSLTQLLYNLALSRAKKLGGKKFHNKQYGGGIVFQSYNIDDTERSIKELLNNI